MKKEFGLMIVLASLLCSCVGEAGKDVGSSTKMDASREQRLINKGWTFYEGSQDGAESVDFDDAAWEQVNVPHSASIPYWMELEVYEGDTWYRKEFAADADLKSRRAFVEFEGAFQHAWVYLNGQLLGEHKGGYTGFCYDMNSALNYEGKNVLAVRVKNGWEATIAPRAGDSIFPNGLNRNVRFIITNDQHVDWCGQFITTPKVSADSASVQVKTDLKNEAATDSQCSLLVEVLDQDGQVVAQAERPVLLPAGQLVQVTQDLPEIAQPNLWSPDSPYLYSVRTRLSNEQGLVDEYHERLGIRWFEFTEDKGFFLNGEHVYLWGFNAHEDRAGWAFAGTDAAMYRDMKLLKEAGANIVRASHNPHPRAFYSACDELGLLVYAELQLWGRGGFKGGEEGNYWAEAYPAVEAPEAEFKKNVKDNFRDMIKERRNNPSVIIWSLGNETAMQMQEPLLSKLRQLYQDLNDLSHELDPTRPTATGNSFSNEGITDISGYNGGAPKNKPGVNKPTLTTEYHFGHEPARDAWRSGAICWSGFDYGTHCARGNGVSFGFFGAVDYHRLPKDKYYVMREQATGIPVPATPKGGTPALLGLSADKLVVKDDGTDDTQLIVALLDKDGNRIANNVPVSFKIISGPGQLPTGKVWDTKTVNMGRQAIEFRSYEPGTTVIEVSSPNAASARIEITTVKG